VYLKKTGEAEHGEAVEVVNVNVEELEVCVLDS
jgi:hypothetical protein